ncbi:Pyoverdine chromophore precursor synthetase PvdL [Enhygromyxa salina]|uniref:Pyoverdine chromophore synthetase PvdL n=1 Tax=Enhygromyxa salina TaxID=215803 RepID=A0A0C2CX48_9BACT|nr:AMP-binding protein [Enhygromyxa salina]KIG15601.1 Pyoverdine chromophore precursor synthetase PvdL [Enhygromyxa salina]
MAETVLFVCGGGRDAATVLELDAGELERGYVRPLEAGDVSTQRRVLIGCGRPDAAAGVSIEVVDRQTRRRCPAGVVGELWLSSPSNAEGYWSGTEADNADRFRAQLVDAPERAFLRTGDLGFLHDGDLFLCGRAKHVLIVGGRNVHAHDLEQSLEQAHPNRRPHSRASLSESGREVVTRAWPKAQLGA